MRPPALLLSALFCAVSLHAEIPPNLVAEGVPPIPPALQTEVSRYLTLGGAGFRGWHTTRGEILVTTRAGNVIHLHRMPTRLGQRTPLTSGPEPVRSGRYQPGG